MEYYNKTDYQQSGVLEGNREFPGAYKIKEVLLHNSIDVTESVAEIIIHESIESFSLFGHVRFHDVFNTLYNERIHGFEKLKIQIEDTNFETTLNLRVYKIADRSQVNPQTEYFTLYFCSEEMFASQHKKISKAYNGERPENIIRDMMKTELGFDDFDRRFYYARTKQDVHCVIPTWDVARACNFLSARSVSVDEDLQSNNFAFFQTLDGFYNFFPIDGLMDNKRNVPFAEITHSYMRNKVGNTFKYDPSSGTRIFSLENLDILNSVDHIMNTNTGMYANRASIIDIHQREVDNKEYDYRKGFVGEYGEEKHLKALDEEQTPYPLVPLNDLPMARNPEASWQPILKSKGLFTNMNDEHRWYNDMFHRKISRNSQIENFVLEGTMPGHLGLMAGMIVKLKVLLPPNTTGGDGITEVNKHMSGEYLVKSMTRRFTIKKFETTIQMVKDATSLNFTK